MFKLLEITHSRYEEGVSERLTLMDLVKKFMID